MKRFLAVVFLAVFISSCGGGKGSENLPPQENSEAVVQDLKLIVPEERTYVGQEKVELQMSIQGASQIQDYCIEIPESWIQNVNFNRDEINENNICPPDETLNDINDKGILSVKPSIEEGKLVLSMWVDLVRRSGKFEESLVVWFKRKDEQAARFLGQDDQWLGTEVPILIEVYRSDPAPVYGCMDSSAQNYNPDATENDGSCAYPIVDNNGNDEPQCEDGSDFQCEEQPPLVTCANGSIVSPEEECGDIEGTLNGTFFGTCDSDLSVNGTIFISVSNGLAFGTASSDTEFLNGSFLGSVSVEGEINAHDTYISIIDWLGNIHGSGELSGNGEWSFVVTNINPPVSCSGQWQSNTG